MRFAVPEGVTKVSAQGQEFQVIHGVIDAPEIMKPHLLAHGCKVAGDSPPEINTSDKSKLTLPDQGKK